jgi:hypothetical protein
MLTAPSQPGGDAYTWDPARAVAMSAVAGTEPPSRMAC